MVGAIDTLQRPDDSEVIKHIIEINKNPKCHKCGNEMYAFFTGGRLYYLCLHHKCRTLVYFSADSGELRISKFRVAEDDS
jgi:hypothetical protein